MVLLVLAVLSVKVIITKAVCVILISVAGATACTAALVLSAVVGLLVGSSFVLGQCRPTARPPRIPPTDRLLPTTHLAPAVAVVIVVVEGSPFLPCFL
jgi:hypothetical protein